MMVLVCAASKHGSTKEIAEAIGRGLTEARLTVEVNDVEEVSDLAQYDAVIGQRRVHGQLARERARVRHRACGRTGRSADVAVQQRTDGRSAPPVSGQGRLDRPDHRSGYAAGPPAVRRQARPPPAELPERALVTAIRAAEGDYRDWDQIASWAAEIAAVLKA